MIGAVIDHLWQSTLFLVGAAVLAAFLRNNAARVRYWVWLAASLKFLIPFSALTFWISQILPPPRAGAPRGVSEFLTNAVQQLAEPLATPEVITSAPTPAGLPLTEIVLAIWVLGGIAFLLRWLVQWLRISAAVRRATPAAIEAPIPVKSTAALWEPGIVGILRPTLLLPLGIEERLTPAQLRAILAHELCHVRHRDNLTATLHMAVEVLFWFHPLVWWLGARLVAERERACDEAVVRLGNEPQAYAEGILRVCQFYMESKLSCVAGVSGADLKKRIEGLMNNRMTANLNAAKKVLLATAASAAIVLPVVAGLATSTLATSTPAAAQTASPSFKGLAFDKVTIAKTPASQGDNVYFTMDMGNLSAHGLPLRALIAFVYDVDATRVVGGPEWLDERLYNIDAKTANAFFAKRGGELLRPLVKTMLNSRFGLQAHPEVQSVPAFVLRVDKGGSKLNVGADLPEGGRLQAHPGQLIGMNVDMKMLANYFAGAMAHPVIDETALTGHYDLALMGKLTAETLPAALHDQAGLTLEPTSQPVEVIVVDSLQTPTLDL